jgi:hypothetical protein
MLSSFTGRRRACRHSFVLIVDSPTRGLAASSSFESDVALIRHGNGARGEVGRITIIEHVRSVPSFFVLLVVICLDGGYLEGGGDGARVAICGLVVRRWLDCRSLREKWLRWGRSVLWHGLWMVLESRASISKIRVLDPHMHARPRRVC